MAERVLSEEQQDRLNRRKVQLRIENERYFRAHPELQLLVSSVVREALDKQPEDPVTFAAEFFTSTDLRKVVEEAQKSYPTE